MIHQILQKIADLIARKNHDYGHAFDHSCDLFGNMYAASKIYEKTMRIITLTKSEAQVKGEPLTDALEDCIGYCTLYLNRLKQTEDKAVSIGALKDKL